MAQTYPLARERNFIIAVLLILAAGAWAVLIWHWATMGNGAMSMADDAMGMGDGDTSMGLTMGMSAAVFLGVWVAMMVAIMFPTAAPMILTFARVQTTKRERGQPHVPTWLFTGSYIALWSATGIVAYSVAIAGNELAEQRAWLIDNSARIGGAVLLVAGIYQLSPLKEMCLSKCRTPMSFILSSWRDGWLGAMRMGLHHGVYCLGCCWLLFVILFPLGMMNVAAMALITLVIFAEKSLALGQRIARGVGVTLIGYGIVILLVPGALPTMLYTL